MAAKTNLKQSARKLRADAAKTAEAAWKTTKDVADAAGEAVGELMEKAGKTADAVLDTTKRKLRSARIKGRELEESARKLVAKGAVRVEKASHDFKKAQVNKARQAHARHDAEVAQLAADTASAVKKAKKSPTPA